MADVFISYVKEERKLTERLASELEAEGFSVWWDSELLPSDDFQKEIDRQLDACNAAIVVWTPKSIDSYWVRSEAQHALRRRRLINVHSADLHPEQIPKPFDVINCTPVTDRDRIMTAVRRLAGAAPIPRPTPRPWWKRYSRRGLAGAALAGCLIAAAVLGSAAWFAGVGRDAPEWRMAETSFLGTVPLKWQYRKASAASLLFEIESYASSMLGLYNVGTRRHPYADGNEKEIDSINGMRFFRVRAVDSQSRSPLSSWSRPLPVTQYDSSYERIKATGSILVRVSDSQNQHIFKWVSDGFQGFDIKLANEITVALSRHLNRTLEHPVKPVSEKWEPLLQSPNEGRADLIVSSITKHASREKKFRIRFSDTYFCTGYALFYRTGEAEKPIRDMIAGRRVGVQGSTTGEELGNALAGLATFKQVPYDNTESMTAAVLKAQVDFGITDTPFALAAQLSNRRGGQDRITYREFQRADFPPSFPAEQQVQEYAVAVREDEIEFLSVINAAIGQLRSSGRLVQLLNESTREYEAYRNVPKGRPVWSADDRPWECAR